MERARARIGVVRQSIGEVDVSSGLHSFYQHPAARRRDEQVVQKQRGGGASQGSPSLGCGRVGDCGRVRIIAGGLSLNELPRRQHLCPLSGRICHPRDEQSHQRETQGACIQCHDHFIAQLHHTRQTHNYTQLTTQVLLLSVFKNYYH